MPEVHFSVTEASFSQAPPATTCRLHIMILAIERMSCAHTLLTGTSRAQDPAHFLNPESMPPRLAGASSSREEGASHFCISKLDCLFHSSQFYGSLITAISNVLFNGRVL